MTSAESARRVLYPARELDPDDLLLALASGGRSAALSLPVEGVHPIAVPVAFRRCAGQRPSTDHPPQGHREFVIGLRNPKLIAEVVA